jgi:hypothetical protein
LPALSIKKTYSINNAAKVIVFFEKTKFFLKKTDLRANEIRPTCQNKAILIENCRFCIAF